jgi:predicted RND superfamily exporter protein
MEYERYIEWADDRIVEDTRKVLLAFLVVTLVFGAGLGNVSTSAGTQQFTTGLPAEEAFERVTTEFSPAFGADTGNTQLIQRGNNVLAKQSLLRMLRAQERMEDTPGLRVASTSSAAGMVARELDPEAETTEAQIRAVESASSGEIDAPSETPPTGTSGSERWSARTSTAGRPRRRPPSAWSPTRFRPASRRGPGRAGRAR